MTGSRRGGLGLGKGENTVLSVALRQMSAGRDFSGINDLIETRGGRTSRRDRKLALTFDDGPVLQTYDVLETLGRAGARGTFFLVGRKVGGHEPLVRRILAGGHEIGNHSFGHMAYPSHEDVLADSAVLEHVTGAAPRFYRPPFGAVDRPTAEAVRGSGMKVILWSVASDDATPLWEGIPPDRVIANVVERAKPGGIVLLHDGLPWSNAARALPSLIERLHEDGYELVTLGELLDDEGDARAGRLGGRRVAGRARPWKRRRDGARKPFRTPGANPFDMDEFMRWLAEGIEVPPGAELAARLIAGARAEMTSRRVVGSEMLVRNVLAEENDAVRVIALGFSLRIAELQGGLAAEPPPDVARQLHDGGDPIAAAAAIARQRCPPTRVDKMVMLYEAEHEGGPSSVDPARLGAQPGFIELFAPGAEVWEAIQSWGRDAGRRAAEMRMRETLDAAGADSTLAIGPVLDRLDVDFFLRFGYVLRACEEAIAA